MFKSWGWTAKGKWYQALITTFFHHSACCKEDETKQNKTKQPSNHGFAVTMLFQSLLIVFLDVTNCSEQAKFSTSQATVNAKVPGEEEAKLFYMQCFSNLLLWGRSPTLLAFPSSKLWAYVFVILFSLSFPFWNPPCWLASFSCYTLPYRQIKGW